MAALLFPLWQIDAQEYHAVCAHLRVTPEARLYDYLSRYLAEAPFQFPRPTGFARYLAMPRLTRFRIARLDPMTKWLLPGHPLRHVLNGVIALHECDARGYRELAVAPLGWRAWLTALALGTRRGRQPCHRPALAGLAMGRLCDRRAISRGRRPRRKARADHRREPRPRPRSHASLPGGRRRGDWHRA